MKHFLLIALTEEQLRDAITNPNPHKSASVIRGSKVHNNYEDREIREPDQIELRKDEL